jgi:hypothetical protein
MLKAVIAIATVALLLAAVTAGAQGLFDGDDIRNSSLTGKDIKNKSLTQQDFRGSVKGPRGPRGAPGPQGLAGPAGPQGPPGPINTSGITPVDGPVSTVVPGGVGSSIAFCPAGQRVVSGGGFLNTGVADGLVSSRANNARTSWFVLGGNNGSIDGTIQAYAQCAGAGAAVAAKVNRRMRERTEREVARLVAKLEASMAAEGQ